MTGDIRLACRGLWRSKTLTATATLMLALGIAGTTVMFALIEGVLLRPLPVRQQDRLILAWKELRTSRSVQYPFGNTEIESVARASRLLDGAAGVTRNGVGRAVMIDHGVSDYANVAEVTGGFFGVLGVEPLLGRTLTTADDNEGAENVIVIASGLWHRRYGASREVLGRRVSLDEQEFTIVGVLPPDLDYPTGVDVWRSSHSIPTSGPFGDAVRREVNLVGRLRAGVTLEQAASEITALNERLEADAPANALHGLVPVVHSFADVVVGDVRRPMLALFIAVGFVLLIACANVANLLLMRGEERRKELAVRVALGAGPGRVVRLLLIESFLITLLSGIGAIAVSYWSLPALIALAPAGLPRIESIRIDPMVVAFSSAIVFVAALLAGIPPAISATRVDLVSQLRSSARALIPIATDGRRALVAGQVALAVVTVAAAGLVIRSAFTLQSVDLGMAASRLVLVELHMPQAKYAAATPHAQFLENVIAQLQAVPIIAAATPVNLAPFSGQGWDLPRFTAEGQTSAQAAANPSLNIESIFPNYFETLGVPLVLGRPFTIADRAGAARVAIVSEDMAAQLWPARNPIGRRLTMGAPDSRQSWYTVVGVAARTRYREVSVQHPTLYFPAAQFQMTATLLVVRSAASLELLAAVMRERLRAIDSDVEVMRIAPFAAMLARPLARPRFSAFLFTVFGISALLLSAVGVYAVVAAYVRHRQPEIALRMALGATTSRTCGFVLAETIRLTGLGVAIGLMGSAGISRLLRGMLYEVSPLDPWNIAGAGMLLTAVSMLVSYLPTRRAARLDPATVLRGE